MTNPLLEIFQNLRNLDPSGGYERYQITVNRLNDAREQLQTLGKDCVPCLKRCLRDMDMQIQQWAIDICDASPTPYKDDIIQLLLFQRKLEKKRTSRQNSALISEIEKMLSQLGDTTIRDDMLTGLESDDDEIRKQALTELGKKPYNKKELLIEIARTHTRIDVRNRAITALGMLRDDADLIDLYVDTAVDTDKTIRFATMQSVMKSRVDDERIAKLALKALDDADVSVKSAVLQSLHFRSLPDTVPRMMNLLSEVRPSFVWTVAKGLSFQIVKFNNLPDDWQPLLDVIDHMEDYPGSDRFASSAFEALQGIGDTSVIPYFVNYLMRDSNYKGYVKHRPSIIIPKTLKAMLDTVDWHDMEAALDPYLQSEDVDQRRAAIQIIGEVGSDDGQARLQQVRTTEKDIALIALLDTYLK